MALLTSSIFAVSEQQPKAVEAEVAMTLEVEELLRAAVEGKRPDGCVFTHEGGKPVKDFRGARRNLCGT